MMQQIKWKYEKEPVSSYQIHALEESLGIVFPVSYKSLLQNAHGARPNKKRFDTSESSGYVLKTFLPITERNQGNMIEVLSWLKGRLPGKLLPFASDAAGNYLCFDFNAPGYSIVLWEHETLTIEVVASSFDEFLERLYA